MATLSLSLLHVKEHLQQIVSDLQIFDICKQLRHVWRDRLLNPAVTVQLFLLQLLAKVAMQGLHHAAGIAVTAQAICKAKKRLPLKLLMALVEQSVPAPATSPSSPAASRWRGLDLYIADGMSFLTADTPALVKRFGKASNQLGTSSGYPVPKLLALMDGAAGFIRRVIALPASRQEYTCLSRLFAAVGPNGLLLGDRGLVSFALVAMMMKAGIHGCFRLPRGRVTFGRGTGSRRRIDRLGKQDMLVGWKATKRPAWLSSQRWEQLPSELVLRQIAYRVHRKGFRVQWAWIITTLLDPQAYPAEEMAGVYDKRWQIEVCFRDLKRTLGLQVISAKSVEGVRKEILAFVLLYNIVRRIMQQAAAQQQTTADRISFIDAVRWLLYCKPGDAIPKLIANPVRKRRSPPRRVKRGRHRFPQLNASRSQSSKPACEVKL